MGIYVSSDSIEAGVMVAKGSLSSFAYSMCDVVFMPEGAKYFSIAGSEKSKSCLETLALPSKYLTGYLCKFFVNNCSFNLIYHTSHAQHSLSPVAELTRWHSQRAIRNQIPKQKNAR